MKQPEIEQKVATTAETYQRIFGQDGDHRVVGDPEELQFIVQRRRSPAESREGREWAHVAFTTSGAAVRRLWREATGSNGAAALRDLPAFPKRTIRGEVVDAFDF